MNAGGLKWIFTHLNDWTWVVAEYRVWLIVIATVIGILLPIVGAARQRTSTTPSLVVRGGAIWLGISSALVTVCALLHFSDLRWLPVSQRGNVHVSEPGGLFSFAKPVVGVVNSVANLPAEWDATQLAVHTAIVCAFLTLAAVVLIVLTWRRARHAEIRQVVQEEIRKMAVTVR